MKKPKFVVVVFAGTNCDRDTYRVIRDVINAPVEYVFHKETDIKGADVVVLPGGFSYGDYLRAGAIAALSPVMGAVKEFAEKGGMVVGICNGFQILIEAGLLKGAMLPNNVGRFISKFVNIRIENRDTALTWRVPREVLRLPIAHAEGRFWAPDDVLDRIEQNNQVVMRYVNEKGEADSEANPNGSLNNIAGIMNEKGNVFGFMPHPERASERVLGSEDGRYLFESMVEWFLR